MCEDFHGVSMNFREPCHKDSNGPISGIYGDFALFMRLRGGSKRKIGTKKAGQPKPSCL
jgi:hypothetical protein